MIGYAFTGSFCTLSRSLAEMANLLAAGYEIQPILSETVWQTDSRFTRAEEFRERVAALCGRPVIHTIADAEPLGPRTPLDALILAPCTGNTLAKLAAGITDTAVTMAAKAHLRCDRPTLIALSSNDSLSQNLHNISTLLLRKQVYFVPLRQDDPDKKPHSLVAEFSLLGECLLAARNGRQLRPLFLS